MQLGKVCDALTQRRGFARRSRFGVARIWHIDSFEVGQAPDGSRRAGAVRFTEATPIASNASRTSLDHGSDLAYGDHMEPAKKLRPAAVKGQTMKGSRPNLILKFVTRRPEQRFRCYEIARHIKQPTEPVARACHLMWTRGQLTRVREYEGRALITYYSARKD